MAEGFAEDGQRIDSLLFRLVATRHFIERAADPGVEDGAGQGGSGQGGSGQGGSGQGGSGQGGSDPGTGQGGSGSSSGGGNTSDLAVSVVEDSHWGTGYCSSVKVENTGSAAVTWSVSLDLDGTLTDVWNAESAPDGAKTKFVGLAYNATLDPGQTASFGFCATLQ
ncbi:MAG: cellulose binding domain-containing protein [Polyangiaceae bacterium]